MRLVSRRAATLAGVVAALSLPAAALPAFADDAPPPDATCTVSDAPVATIADPGGWTLSSADQWRAGGVRVSIDDSTSLNASHTGDFPLAEAANLATGYDGTPTTKPGVQLVVDFRGQGRSDDTSVLTESGDTNADTEWVLDPAADSTIRDAAPEVDDATAQGTAAAWATAFPDAAVHSLGYTYAPGSGAADATITSVTAGCFRYTFGLAPLGTPVVTLGAAKVGATLTPGVTGWSAAPDSVTYAWTVGSTTAATATYKPVAADAGKSLSLAVTGTKPGYTPATSAPASTVVASADFAGSPNPTISGTVRVGSKVTASLGSWSPKPTAVAYQWRVDGKNVTGATGSSFVPRAADRGHHLTVAVTATLPGYTTLVRSSAAATVGYGVFSAAKPTITGSSQVGSKLTAHRGTWSPGATTYAYQWLRSGKAIKGATKSTYKVVSADASKSISVRVTGKATGYTTKVVTSASVKATKPFTTTHAPTISGTTRVSSTLTAHVTAWSPKASLHYQWNRNGKAIPGATKSTYKLAKADHGSKITVSVKGTRSGYTTKTKTSKATASIAWPKGVSTPKITKQPTWSGVAMNGKETFSVKASGGALHYQWQYSADGARTWKTYAGKTSSALTVTAVADHSLYQYRVVVSNVVTSVTSRAVLLGIVSSQAAPFGVDDPFLLDAWGAQMEETEDYGSYDSTHDVVGAATDACYEGEGTLRPGDVLSIRLRVGGTEYDGSAVVGDTPDYIGSVGDLATGKCAWFTAYAVVPTSVLNSAAFDKAVWAITDNTNWTNFTQYVSVR